jgi:hypothetical protein
MTDTFQQLTQQQQLLTQTLAQLAAGKPSHTQNEPNLSGITRHVKPPEFHGDKDDTWDLDTWEFQVKEFLALYGNLTPEAQIRVAGGFLRGNAATWFRDLRQKPTAEQPKDLDAFFACLKAVFQPIGTAKQARERLHTARMRDRESVAAYTTYMKRLFLAVPNMSEEDRLDKYVHGLTTRLRTEVMVRDPQTVEEAARFAANFEAALRLAHGSNGYRSNSYGYDHGSTSHARAQASGPTPMEVDALSKSDNRTSRGASSRGSSRPPSRPNNRDMVCYWCRKPGHLARNCRERIQFLIEQRQATKPMRDPKNERSRAHQQRSNR